MPGDGIAGPAAASRAEDGSADPAVAAALAAWAAGSAGEHDVLLALASARLLVPIVAVLTEAEEGAPARTPPARPASPARPPAAGPVPPAPARGPSRPPGLSGPLKREKTTEMALPTLIGQDGRAALIAFTSLAAVTRWRPDARPVPTPAPDVWTAGQETGAVVIDVAGPVPFAIDGARLAALAGGRPVPPPWRDPDLLALAETAFTPEPAIASVAVRPGQEGADLTIAVTLAPGHTLAAAQEALARAARALTLAAAGRLRRGVALAVTAGEGGR